MFCSCPCLKCTVKIIQAGVKEVVYNLSYKMYVYNCIKLAVSDLLERDDASAALFQQAGVTLRRYAAPPDL
jgi:dCMP deaminase